MDRASVFTIDTGLPKDDSQPDDQPGEIQKAFRAFILEFRIDNTFIYRLVSLLVQLLCLFVGGYLFWSGVGNVQNHH